MRFIFKLKACCIVYFGYGIKDYKVGFLCGCFFLKVRKYNNKYYGIIYIIVMVIVDIYLLFIVVFFFFWGVYLNFLKGNYVFFF